MHWIFGDQTPRLVTILRRGQPPVSLKTALIDPDTKAPTSIDFVVPAPDILSLIASPRSVAKDGTVLNDMPDDNGVFQSFDKFVVELANLLVAPESLPPPPQHPPAPSNLRAQIEKGRYTVF